MPTLPRTAVPRSESAPVDLTSTSLWPVYFPGLGIVYSFGIHGIALAVVLHLMVVRHSLDPFEPLEPGHGGELQMVMYLPTIGGGGQGGGGDSEPAAEGPAPPSPGTRGLVYPGPQLIRSDSPDPTSTVQTLLRAGSRRPSDPGRACGAPEFHLDTGRRSGAAAEACRTSGPAAGACYSRDVGFRGAAPAKAGSKTR